MTDLKNLKINVYGNLLEYETVQISVNDIPAEYTPDEVLSLLGKLSELQKTLTDNLITNRMKQLRLEEEN
jgi:hypothetical protein